MVELRSWSKALGAKVNNSNGKDLSINDDDYHDDDDDDRDGVDEEGDNENY